MDNERHGIRASGVHATYDGRDYLAQRLRDRVRILSDDDPLPPDFQTSKKSWVRGEAIVSMGAIQRLVRVRTTCEWRGHPFEVGIIVGDTAYVTYLGKQFDEVSDLPGMERPDKYEVLGEIPVSELADVDEQVEELPLGDQPTDETRRRDLT
jgi:hypothetical protein